MAVLNDANRFHLACDAPDRNGCVVWRAVSELAREA